MKEEPKRKTRVTWGGLGHPRSLAMSLFIRTVTSFYLPAILLSLSTLFTCCVCQLFIKETWWWRWPRSRDHDVTAIPYMTFHRNYVYTMPHWGWNFIKINKHQKTRTLDYRAALFVWRTCHAHSPPLSGRGCHALTWRSHGHSLAAYLWRHLRHTVVLRGKCTPDSALTG